MSLPAWYRGGSEPNRSGCSCLVVALVAGLAVGGFLLWLGIYAVHQMEGAWQK